MAKRGKKGKHHKLHMKGAAKHSFGGKHKKGKGKGKYKR